VATGATYFYEPAKGHGLKHSPFKAIVAPRPIGWISTIDSSGNVNLAPYSFFNAVSEQPPMVAFSSYERKDSVKNIELTGEFVVNLATRDLADAMNLSSAPLPHGSSEADYAGLQMSPCRVVKAPRVAASPAALECKLVQIVQLSDLSGQETSNFLVIGQVVGVHIAEACLEDGLFDIVKAGTIARCGYLADYAQVTELFQVHRPK
jgi:flavin reductase (DIM6/NTAB) family NADH-FMN oxidoreductase RutF